MKWGEIKSDLDALKRYDSRRYKQLINIAMIGTVFPLVSGIALVLLGKLTVSLFPGWRNSIGSTMGFAQVLWLLTLGAMHGSVIVSLVQLTRIYHTRFLVLLAASISLPVWAIASMTLTSLLGIEILMWSVVSLSWGIMLAYSFRYPPIILPCLAWAIASAAINQFAFGSTYNEIGWDLLASNAFTGLWHIGVSPVLAITVLQFAKERGIAPPFPSLCSKCQYDLAGIDAARCPECGELTPRGDRE